MARILIIDDDLMVSRMLQEQLRNDGYEVSAAYMAEEGFAMALQWSPDLIFLDVHMPDATGFQMCHRLRTHVKTATIPIIMMTGAARWPNQQAIGLGMGANEYILKPFNVFEVANRVRKLLGSPAAPQEPATPEFLPTPVAVPEPIFDVPKVEVKPEIKRELPPTVSAEFFNAQNFFDFSVEIVILVSRLPKTRAGRHLADQLLRCGTAVGARVQEWQTESDEQAGQEALKRGLKDLREAGYWLMLTSKARLIENPSAEDLETVCKELIKRLVQHVQTLPQNAQLPS